jgi:hypothetical protein
VGGFDKGVIRMLVRSSCWLGGFRWSIAVAALLTLAGGCSRHVRLVFPETEKASRYVCREGGGPCEAATSDIPSERNRSGTTQITMPAQCGGRFQEIVVLDADSSDPTVDVTCAVADDADGATSGGPESGIEPDPNGGIGTMQ